MELLKFFLFFSFLFSVLAAGHVGTYASSPHRHHHHRQHLHEEHRQCGFRPTKLFVFGDSYADTGNIQKSIGSSWKDPYGSTFPGKPAGRFSDGRVLTDYVAKFYGLKSPVAYRWMKYAGKRLRLGVNFAYGGTGVFDTPTMEPNMTTQIDFFEKLLNDNSVYNISDLRSSLFLVTLAGNDYGAYLATGGSAQGLPGFISRVVNQLAVNLKRIQGLGARKIAVTALEPLGCLPRTTIVSSFQQCNVSQNEAVSFHNLLLNQAVAKLNNESKDSAFAILDLFGTFSTVLENKDDFPASVKFETPLKPCCIGISAEYNCGSVNQQGQKMYNVCNDAQSAFFWDGVHPTQAGWHAVYTVLKATLEQIQ